MTRQLERLDALAASLRLRADALGLLALGSVGIETVRLDASSDLDFFVIVRPGAKARYLDSLDWLAQAHPLVWAFRNTVDGYKAWMRDGIFCEFAVFEADELIGIPYAPGRWIWRRESLPESLAASSRPLPATASADWLLGEALSNLFVGLQRHARGERLAAMRMVQVFALDRLLELTDLLEPGETAPTALRDPFNADRRVEQRHPLLAASLPVLAGGYMRTPAAASAILAALQRLQPVPADIATRIRALIDSAPTED